MNTHQHHTLSRAIELTIRNDQPITTAETKARKTEILDILQPAFTPHMAEYILTKINTLTMIDWGRSHITTGINTKIKELAPDIEFWQAQERNPLDPHTNPI